MDIFNSALKNPVPPIRKDTILSESPSITSTTASQSPSAQIIVGGSSEHSHSRSESTTPSDFNNNVLVMNVSNAGETSALEASIQKKKKNSRRKHRNSHLGCGTCKKRRIKCDETLPSCLNCLKGKLHCAYLNLDAPARNALRVAQFNQSTRLERSPQDQDNDPTNQSTNSNNSNSSQNSPQLPTSVLNATSAAVASLLNSGQPMHQVPILVGMPMVVPTANSVASSTTSPPNGIIPNSAAANPMDYYAAAAAQAQAQAQAHVQIQAQAQAQAHAQANANAHAHAHAQAQANAQVQAQVQAQAHAQAQHQAQAQAHAHAQAGFAVPYPVMQASSIMQAAAATGHPPPGTQIIQSPYGPLVSIQPSGPYNSMLNTAPGIPQAIPQQISQQHVMYSNASQQQHVPSASLQHHPSSSMPLPVQTASAPSLTTQSLVSPSNVSSNIIATQPIPSAVPLKASPSTIPLTKLSSMASGANNASTSSLTTLPPKFASSITTRGTNSPPLKQEDKKTPAIAINTSPNSSSITLPPINQKNLSVPPMSTTSLSPNSPSHSISLSNPGSIRTSPNLLSITKNHSFTALPSIASNSPPNNDDTNSSFTSSQNDNNNNNLNINNKENEFNDATPMVVDLVGSNNSKNSVEISPVLPPIKQTSLLTTHSASTSATSPEINSGMSNTTKTALTLANVRIKSESPDGFSHEDIKLPPIKSLNVGSNTPPRASPSGDGIGNAAITQRSIPSISTSSLLSKDDPSEPTTVTEVAGGDKIPKISKLLS